MTRENKPTKNQGNTMQDTMTQNVINGIDVEALRGAIAAISEDSARGQTNWRATTEWKGGTRNDTRITGYSIGGQQVEKDYLIRIDEPLELCGSNQYANPQEYLLGAVNSCIMVGYAAACSLEGIELESLRLETEGDIDLRGFLGIDPDVPAGYDEIRYKVFIKAKATEEQLQKVHDFVSKTAPNRYNMMNAIPMRTTLVVED
jgi:uncharacterized OsmC-like protein